jgi:hypothetical protein
MVDQQLPVRNSRTIDVASASEVEYWSSHLHTTKDEIFAAISEVGASARKVKEHLRKKRASMM